MPVGIFLAMHMTFIDKPDGTEQPNTQKDEPRVLNLALQGGGSHGAFAWGVLDRLLQEGAINFEGISGTSAGAANAVVLADGFAAGGRDGARAALRRYWQRVSDVWSRGPFKPPLISGANSDFGLEHSPGFRFIEPMTHFASPYQLNPFNFNPFRDMLAEAIDFERVRQQKAIKLFICATDVQTAKVKIFIGEELGVDHVLASTCLPLLMQAVEIDGAYYWDGMYSGNPAIYPLVYECESRDILLVHITPAERPGVPTTSPAIMNRMQEISSNTSLIREMRMISSYNKLIERGVMGGGKRMLMHVIEAEEFIRAFSWSSRLNADWDFLQHLHKMGRARADQWLNANFDRIGTESTVDLDSRYF
jgi:NTE family protein